MKCGLSVASAPPSHFPARSNYLSDYLLRMNAMRALCHPVLPSFSSSTRSPTPCRRRRRLPTFSAAPRRRADRWILAAAPEAMASTQPWTAQEQEKAKEAKLWGGRFEDSVTDAVERFSESVSFDKALYKQDIMGSRAHARMLAHQGLMTVSDRDSILHGLDEIERRIEAGEFVWRMDREDVHMNIEAALTEVIGEPAKKLHTARSRNDQVVTDLRLWCREATDKIVASIKQLQVALIKLGLSNEGLIVPGYTHLQRAQPVLLQHLLLSYVEQLERDVGRLVDCKDRMNFCPLGACALAGTGLPIDRFLTSDALGFTAPMRNSIDAVSDRDFVLEFLSANSIAAVHLSRLGEEWVLWASEEFGFLTPSDSVSTGSSIMPQKKNPDPMELVRGKSARVVGDLMTLLVLCKGLPQAYNRDLQEDKEPLFDSVKTVLGMLEVTTEFAQNITFNHARIRKVLPAGHLDATTLADYLVNKGLPFRTSHEIVGRCVALCVARNCQLSELPLDQLQGINSIFKEDVYDFLGVENSVNKFSSYGSTGSECVAEQLSFWISKLQIGQTENEKTE
ncbi:argininosuccinate lyase, chloroplastic [Musa acuminata AAA Group]|uniref:argininosuccinate lyase, chloroplastic n=1 Tax=Musa acuminata AAA Group TaxID=214697 RepID=UPI0031DDDAA7